MKDPGNSRAWFTIALWLLCSALVTQSNCKPGFTGQLKWVYSCLVSGSWAKQAMNPAQDSYLFQRGGSRSPGSPSTELSHWARSRVIVGAISVSTVQYSEILWDFQWVSACPNLIAGAVLLAYKSNPTQWERVPPPCLPPLCTEQCGLRWVSVLHCWGGCFAMTPTKVSASYLQYRMGLWSL